MTLRPTGQNSLGMTDKTSLFSHPLTMNTGEWRLRLAELCQDCAIADCGEEAGPLRQALHLMAQAPDADDAGMGAMADHLPPQAHFEALLGLGAYDSAAMALMPEQASYILSRSASGQCLASVLLPDVDEEMTSQAQTPALALVSALMACLATMAGRAPRMVDEDDDDEAGFERADWHVPPGVRLH